MKVVDLRPNQIVVQFNSAELTILNNALNEVCNGIEVAEFVTRVGAELLAVQQLLKEVHDLVIHDNNLVQKILDERSDAYRRLA